MQRSEHIYVAVSIMYSKLLGRGGLVKVEDSHFTDTAPGASDDRDEVFEIELLPGHDGCLWQFKDGWS